MGHEGSRPITPEEISRTLGSELRRQEALSGISPLSTMDEVVEKLRPYHNSIVAIGIILDEAGEELVRLGLKKPFHKDMTLESLLVAGKTMRQLLLSRGFLPDTVDGLFEISRHEVVNLSVNSLV